jgi:hypothetical protein
MRAEISAPADDLGISNGCTTYHTGLPPALVDPMPGLKGPGHPFPVHVVAHRRPSKRDGFLKDLSNHLEEPTPLIHRKCVSQPPWMEPGAKEAFIYVNISKTRDKSLIQEQGLEGTGTLQKGKERVFIHLKRVRANLPEYGMGGEILPFYHFKPPELA